MKTVKILPLNQKLLRSNLKMLINQQNQDHLVMSQKVMIKIKMKRSKMLKKIKN